MDASPKLHPLPVAPPAERQLLIRDLIIDWRIGVHPHEHMAPQRVRLNMELWFVADTPIEDRLGNTVCYESLINRLKEMAIEQHLQLVETLADSIADLCFEDSRVNRVAVTVEKLDVFPEAVSVGTRLDRRRG